MTEEQRRQFVQMIKARADATQCSLASSGRLASFVDTTLSAPAPFFGSDDIRLVIIGQDPTIQNIATRAKIKTVLNLDKEGSLRSFIEKLCSDLGLELDKHIYATNAAKGFFIDPPTKIWKDHAVDVLVESGPVWLPILQEELGSFPKAAVVSLGEPVLAMLSSTGPSKMGSFWGYHKDWQQGTFVEPMKLAADQNVVGRDIFPFVHEPTTRGRRTEFYRERREAYMSFIRQNTGLVK